MMKVCTALAALGVAAMFATPVQAEPTRTHTDGVRSIEQMEFSAQRRHARGNRHWQRRHVAPRRYYRPYGYAYRPYGYRYRPYGYYRPYRPGLSFGFSHGPRVGFY
jgi:hypothetical protein